MKANLSAKPKTKSIKFRIIILICFAVLGLIVLVAYIFFVMLGRTSIIPPIIPPKDQEIIKQTDITESEESLEGIRQEPVHGQR